MKTLDPATLLTIGRALNADHPRAALAAALNISHRSIARMIAGTLDIPPLRPSLAAILDRELAAADRRRAQLAAALAALGPE
jgi:hypothetical protein